MDMNRLESASARFSKSSGFHPSYGTAGFRAEGGQLHSTIFRCGILMALRSSKTQGITGIVVTASHNPAEDNGVKLVEPSGYMLTQSWEVMLQAYADELANAEDDREVCNAIQRIIESENIEKEVSSAVWIGHDTRPSCKELVAAAWQGIEAAGGRVENKGLLTTPQLHWMIRQRNKSLPCTEADYFSTLAEAYHRLTHDRASGEALVVDCANGVGGPKLAKMQQKIQELSLDLRNTGSGPLNGKCGADFVQKGVNGAPSLPTGFQDVLQNQSCASIDGDADRIVFFSPSPSGFTLLDGDRIAVLAALLINSLISELKDSTTISVGIVQTAYANGSSTRYMREELGMTVRLAKTGVKHLHHIAESFDIGIYFEANGHGTVLFKDDLLISLEKEASKSTAARAILDIAALINQAVGDAISCLLLVEVALHHQKWSLQQWAALYEDLPSCMLKVKVPDRSLFTTTDAETKLLSPSGLQSIVDGLVEKYAQGRCFVRPSGTEDVVRIYAEAETVGAAHELASKVSNVVSECVNHTS